MTWRKNLYDDLSVRNLLSPERVDVEAAHRPVLVPHPSDHALLIGAPERDATEKECRNAIIAVIDP